MRLITKLDPQDCGALAHAHVRDRLRWMLGTNAGMVRSARVALHSDGDVVSCTIRMVLKRGERVEANASAEDALQALEFVAQRAASAVARHLERVRILGVE